MSESTLDYRSVIESESNRFADMLATGPGDAPVPSCPEWTLRDLGGHLGTIQRWATTIVERGTPGAIDEVGDAEIAEWFRASTAGLLSALDKTSPDKPCWTLDPGNEGTVGFWHRRQALEVAIHRWDAELAAIGAGAPLDPVLAADVIDEWVNFRIPRNLWRDQPDLDPLAGDVHLHCTDTPGEWTWEIVDGQLVIVAEHRKAAVAAKGSASDLALFCYGRGDAANVEVFGDSELLGRWLATARS